MFVCVFFDEQVLMKGVSGVYFVSPNWCRTPFKAEHPWAFKPCFSELTFHNQSHPTSGKRVYMAKLKVPAEVVDALLMQPYTPKQPSKSGFIRFTHTFLGRVPCRPTKVKPLY